MNKKSVNVYVCKQVDMYVDFKTYESQDMIK